MTNIISLGAVRTAILLAAASTAGCLPVRSATDTARSSFADNNSCPEDRVKVTTVDGPLPPAEIRDDPERVALWRKRNPESYVRVEGCRRAMTYACSKQAHSSSEGSFTFMSCGPSLAAMQDEVIQRAAIELRCPATSLRVVRADVSLELEGCGTHALYQYDPAKQDWVLSPYAAPMFPAATPVPPPTPPAPPVSSDSSAAAPVAAPVPADPR